ncbi:hypothetical protein Scep_022868 [Stephania cephalantha]|uniref:RRM domain-containing protein n=1 Tax=Stephania cephalantha TaxID=152367 RepID=A0AAP0F702_9MAGN
MANSLDMSLDDLIKNRNISERGRGRGSTRRGRGRVGSFGRGSGRAGGNMIRRGTLRANTRPSSFAIAKPFSRNKDFTWQHDLFAEGMVAAGYSTIETGTKLYVSNLDYGVTNEDIKELFSEIGELKRYTVHYDRNGRPSGSAEVVFTKRADALAAMKRYNNVQLDGKAMKIEIIGTNMGMPVSTLVNVIGGANGRGRRTVVMPSGIGRGRGFAPVSRGSRFNRGGGGGGGVRGRARPRGRGRGRGRRQPVEKSAEDLDKDLDSYHAEAMQTS